MRGGYIVLYPDEPTQNLFEGFLRQLTPAKKESVIGAILSLEENPRSASSAVVRYAETNPETMSLYLRVLPGIPFSRETSGVVSDYLYANHRITLNGVTVVYAIDERKKYVWLMGIREAP